MWVRMDEEKCGDKNNGCNMCMSECEYECTCVMNEVVIEVVIKKMDVKMDTGGDEMECGRKGDE